MSLADLRVVRDRHPRNTTGRALGYRSQPVWVVIGWVVVMLLPLAGNAQSTATTEADFEVERVVSSLANPSSIAWRPQISRRAPSELFICENRRGRIVRIRSDQPDKVEVVIDGFRQGELPNGPGDSIGPQAIAFVGGNPDYLAVTEVEATDDTTRVRVFRLPAKRERLEATDAAQDLTPVAGNTGDEESDVRFADLVDNGVALFISSFDDQSTIYMSPVQAATLRAPPRPFATSKDWTGLAGRHSLAISPDGYLLVAQLGDVVAGSDSLLTFVSPPVTASDVARRGVTGKFLLTLTTGLRDIVALAYAPQSGNLYAADFAANDPEQGGIYRLDDAGVVDGQRACRATRIASVPWPTDMAFAADGVMWVVARSDPNQNPSTTSSPDDEAGVLLRITGAF